MTAQIFVTIVAVFILQYLCGSLCQRMALNKGYDDPRYFWIGFIFSILGCMVVASLPDRHR